MGAPCTAGYREVIRQLDPVRQKRCLKGKRATDNETDHMLVPDVNDVRWATYQLSTLIDPILRNVSPDIPATEQL